MGQYYLVCNLDKRQFLHPNALGDGLKLREFGQSACGTLYALTVLLADGNGRGLGDLNTTPGSRWPGDTEAIGPEHPLAGLVGAWAGDRIVMAGDYADPGQWPGEARNPLYDPKLPDTHIHDDGTHNTPFFDLHHTARDHGWLDVSHAIGQLIRDCDPQLQDDDMRGWAHTRDVDAVEHAIGLVSTWLSTRPTGWTDGQKDHYRKAGPGKDVTPRTKKKKATRKKTTRKKATGKRAKAAR